MSANGLSSSHTLAQEAQPGLVCSVGETQVGHDWGDEVCCDIDIDWDGVSLRSDTLGFVS